MSFYGKSIIASSVLTSALNALSAIFEPSRQALFSAAVICLLTVVIVFAQLTIRNLEQIVRAQS